MSNALARPRYNKFLSDLGALIVKFKKDAGTFCWQMGCRIVEEDQHGALRAERGAELLKNISADLTKRYGSGFSVDSLENMRRLFLANPKSEPARIIPWTNQVELLRVKDLKMRKALEERAAREGLKRAGLRKLIRETIGTDGRLAKPLPPLVRPTDLRLRTYKYGDGGRRTETKRETFDVTSPSPSLVSVLDLGFFVSHSVTKKQVSTVTITDTPSYTYSATVDRIVDGDTLWALIDLGFNITVREKLRFRGIDCPELGTPAGDKAKKFVEKLLPAGSQIVIHSEKTKTEKWGRFLADVFYLKPDSVAGEIIEDGVYLNQELLDKGYAVRMEE
jgi:endonuclease YncB( thermonuclease family)